MSMIRTALVVQNCPANKFERNLTNTLKAVSKAVELKADIIVFPEMNLTGYANGTTTNAISLEPEWISKLTEQASLHDIAILSGLVEQSQDNKIYATQLVFRPNLPPARYRKIHVSPFEAPHFCAGNSVRVFEFKGVKFGIQLCYDAHFPELSTAMALKNTDIIFIPHASPRGDADQKFTSWMRHLPARAFDNGVFIAAVNQTGKNGAGLEFPGLALAIGPDGHLVSKKLSSRQTIHTVDMDMSALDRVRSHKMRYFLPNRRENLIKKEND